MSNADAETISYEPAGPRVVWPRNGAGAYATIAELMEAATEATEHCWAIP
jgi:hypothetical protein